MLQELKLYKFREKNSSLNPLCRNTINRMIFIMSKIQFLNRLPSPEPFLFPLPMFKRFLLLERSPSQFQIKNKFLILSMSMKPMLRLLVIKRKLQLKLKRKMKIAMNSEIKSKSLQPQSIMFRELSED